MTWQFWAALVAFVVAAALGIRREIINHRFVREYLASLWIHEQTAIEAERKCTCDRATYARQRHLFGIAQGYREARTRPSTFYVAIGDTLLF